MYEEDERCRISTKVAAQYAEGLGVLKRCLGLLPKPPLTVDQVKLLKRDNVVSGLFPGLPELGVRPTALEAIIPSYLDRFRRGGWYASLK